MLIGSLCSGYGGLDMAIQAAIGGELAWVSDYEPPTEKNPNPPQSAAKVLAHRYDVPNLGDMTAINWSRVPPVAVLSGGTPCQDVSHAGRMVGMRSGTRSGLWASMAEGIDTLRPRLVVWENVRGVLSAGADSGVEPCPLCVGDGAGTALRALGRVLGDLADLGYDARWCGLPASSVGAPHNRYRVFVVAHPHGEPIRQQPVSERWSGRQTFPGWCGPAAPDADMAGLQGPGSEVTDQVGQRPRADAGGVGPAEGGRTAPDAHGDGLEGFGRVEHVERDPDGRGGEDVAWGPYEPAIRRWEGVTLRPAPAPTELSSVGSPRLSARFSEWLMGLPAGWVTDVSGLSRSEQLKVLGNGVVPQQGAAAIRHLLSIT